MDNSRESSIGRYEILKKQIYELAIKAQSHVHDIQEEVNSFSQREDDFTSMDFKKVRTLAGELIQLQNEYKIKSREMLRLKETFNIED